MARGWPEMASVVRGVGCSGWVADAAIASTHSSSRKLCRASNPKQGSRLN